LVPDGLGGDRDKDKRDRLAASDWFFQNTSSRFGAKWLFDAECLAESWLNGVLIP
jgi:hypothetical protein